MLQLVRIAFARLQTARFGHAAAAAGALCVARADVRGCTGPSQFCLPGFAARRACRAATAAAAAAPNQRRIACTGRSAQLGGHQQLLPLVVQRHRPHRSPRRRAGRRPQGRSRLPRRNYTRNSRPKLSFWAENLFLTEVAWDSQSTTGGGSVAACTDTPTPDLEPNVVGTYDDTILKKLDVLLYEASQRGLKLTVALHDRWSLGCWRTDAYVKKYNIPRAPSCSKEPGMNDPTVFYESRAALADFTKRIEHILSCEKHAQFRLDFH